MMRRAQINRGLLLCRVLSFLRVLLQPATAKESAPSRGLLRFTLPADHREEKEEVIWSTEIKVGLAQWKAAA